MELKTEILPVHFEAQMEMVQAVSTYLRGFEATGKVILRWGLVKVEERKVLLEVASLVCSPSVQHLAIETTMTDSGSGGVHVSLVIPTGVGAAIGGFIGDAGPIARTLDAVADSVIVHPNVVNAGSFYSGSSRNIYVDGLTLDRFFEGKVRLGACQKTKIGLIIDRLDEKSKVTILNSANAMRGVNAIDMVGYVVCEQKVRVHVSRTEYSHFVGEVENPEVLFQAAEILRERGANAIAVVTAIDGISAEDVATHYMGIGPNPVGAVEALISRAITWKTGLPCAHAPAYIEGLGESSTLVDPRAAAEVASGSGLPCVLHGLMHTPKIVERGGIGITDLSAIIIPYECAGGLPAFAALRYNIPLLAVKSNRCTVGVSVDQLSIPTAVVLENYAEAIAFVACLKAGVNWHNIVGPVGYLSELGLNEPTLSGVKSEL